MCARAPPQSCQIKVFAAPQRCFGAYLGCSYRRGSVYLALLWMADRLDDELGLKRRGRNGAPSLPELPQAGSWQGCSEPLSHKLCARGRSGLHGS